MQEYAVLGMHENVSTIEGNLVRVRMFVADKMIDEDFALPRIITIEEQVDTAVKARITEIKAKGTDPVISDVVDPQVEQIIQEIPNV